MYVAFLVDNSVLSSSVIRLLISEKRFPGVGRWAFISSLPIPG